MKYLQNDLSRILRKELYNKNNKVFLCIGTNKCIGDSLGPRIGEILNEKLYKNRDLLKQFGDKSILRFLNNFTQEKYVARTNEVIIKVLNNEQL